jgi:hypothetical protein
LLHVKLQASFTQAGTALATIVEQALPHVPQFEGLVRSTHSPLHAVSRTGQPPEEASSDGAPPSISTPASFAALSASAASNSWAVASGQPSEQSEYLLKPLMDAHAPAVRHRAATPRTRKISIEYYPLLV